MRPLDRDPRPAGRGCADGGARARPRACAARSRPRAADDGLLDLASNDYLGLARDPRLVEARGGAARDVGRRLDRLAAGHRLHRRCTPSWRRALAAFTGAPARPGVLLRLPGQPRRPSTALAARRPGRVRRAATTPRSSTPAGCRAARVGRSPRTATSTAVDAALATGDERARGRRHRRGVLGGRRPGAARRAARGRPRGTARCSSSTRRTRSAWSGPGGRGAAHAAGLAGEPDVVRTVTLSKSLGSQGGAVLGAPERDRDAGGHRRAAFIFDTGLAPPSAGAALAALRVLRSRAGAARPGPAGEPPGWPPPPRARPDGHRAGGRRRPRLCSASRETRWPRPRGCADAASGSAASGRRRFRQAGVPAPDRARHADGKGHQRGVARTGRCARSLPSLPEYRTSGKEHPMTVFRCR